MTFAPEDTLTFPALTGEHDPNGVPAGIPGSKLDGGKIRADLLQDFSPALMAVAHVLDFGAKKYCDHGWTTVPNGVVRYRAAFWRHLLQDGVDSDSGLPHLWHAAWNLLAVITLLEKDNDHKISDPTDTGC